MALSPIIKRMLVNEARFGYNSFFNSLGRELANSRDVVGELNMITAAFISTYWDEAATRRARRGAGVRLPASPTMRTGTHGPQGSSAFALTSAPRSSHARPISSPPCTE